MKRFYPVSFVLAAAFCFTAARASDTLKERLSVVPADATIVIAVPNVGHLDADYQKAVATLGLQAFVPPPMNSLVGALRANAPMLAGIDESGAAFVVVMPPQSIFEIQQKQALIIPAKDPKAMIEALGGVPGEDDLFTVQFFGMPSSATIVKNHVVVAMAADVAKAIKASTAGFDGKLSAAELKTLAGLDVFVWLNAQKLIEVTRPMIDGMLMPMLMGAAGQGGFEAASAEMNKKSINMMLDGMATLSFGLGMEDAGLDLRFSSTMRPGSDLAKRSQVRPSAESLLRGLASSNYLFAFGQTIHPIAMKNSMEDLEGLTAFAQGSDKFDKAKVEQLQKLLSDMGTAISAMRGTIEGLPAGPDGLFGMTVVIETSDSGKWIAMTKEAVELGRQIATDAMKSNDGGDQDKAQAMLKALTYSDAGEKIAGADVSHLRFDLAGIADAAELDEEEIDRVKKLIGKEGVLFRVASADGKQVVISFGGGEPNAAKAIEAAKSSDSPLEASPGIKSVGANLPAERAMVAYLSVDRIVRTIQAVQKAMDEEVLPIQVPPLQSPIGMSATGGDGWSQMDIFFPMELITEGKNAVMAMMGGGPPQDNK